MVPRPRPQVWTRLHRAQAKHLVRGTNVTNRDRGFPRARRARPRASGPLASYRDVGREDHPWLKVLVERSARRFQIETVPFGGVSCLIGPFVRAIAIASG